MMYTKLLPLEKGIKLKNRRKGNFLISNMCVLFESFAINISVYTVCILKIKIETQM